MAVYGSALVGISLLVGNMIGEFLGAALGIDCNVGGVGFAMLLVILICSYIIPEDKMNAKTAEGMKFWQEMYIPVVVGMTATQDVMGALSSGWTALLGGLLAVALSFVALPLLSRERVIEKGASK